jgi:hypothetical protein
MEMVKEQIIRNKEKAKLFLEKNIKAFISNINGDYFFCNILSVYEDFIIVKGFAGRRKYEEEKIYFLDIKRFEEYEEKTEVKE